MGRAGLAGMVEIKSKLTVEIRPTGESRVLELTGPRLVGWASLVIKFLWPFN